MSILAAFTRLRAKSPAEQRLLRRIAALYILAHAAVRFTSLPSARTFLAAAARRLGARATSVTDLAAAISSVNRHLPGKHSCLVEALCCEAVARNSGIAAEMKLGAALGKPRMRFHAWVEHEGQVIAGEHDGEFTPFG